MTPAGINEAFMDRDQAIKLMQELLKRVVERAASDLLDVYKRQR